MSLRADTVGWDVGKRRIVDEVDLRAEPGSIVGLGERQRVQIARASAQEPTVMILDEPTNHLDIKYQLSLLELVAEQMRTAPAAAVMALHDLNLAAMFCDEVMVLDEGRVVAAGPPSSTITADAIDGVFGARAAVTNDDDGLFVRLHRQR